MGGCIDKTIQTNKYKYATLTPDGVFDLAHQGYRVNIDARTIGGKSKAGFVGKALVCIQVIGFVTGCIVSKVGGLSLALAEVHTMVHVICALAMYALWWKVTI